MQAEDELKSMIIDYRNSIKSSLDNEALNEIDIYIEKVLDDMQPVLKILNKLNGNTELLAQLKKQLDTHIRENKWQEKLLNRSSTQ
jgi:hypothetical protein